MTLYRPPEVEKRIVGTKSKALGGFLKHGHSRARAKRATDPAVGDRAAGADMLLHVTCQEEL